jgi:hypothetical protein
MPLVHTHSKVRVRVGHPRRRYRMAEPSRGSAAVCQGCRERWAKAAVVCQGPRSRRVRCLGGLETGRWTANSDAMAARLSGTIRVSICIVVHSNRKTFSLVSADHPLKGSVP